MGVGSVHPRASTAARADSDSPRSRNVFGGSASLTRGDSFRVRQYVAYDITLTGCRHDAGDET
jgi:hypothetical protein